MTALPEEWILAWWRWLVPLAIQGGVLLLLVAVVDLLLPRQTWPQLRRGLWLLALVRLVLPPALASPLALAQFLPLSWSLVRPLDPTLAATDPARAEGILHWASALVTLWLAGVVLLTLEGLFRGWRTTRTWRGAARDSQTGGPAWLPELTATLCRRLGLRRLPRIILHPQVQGPCVLGLFRPRVLLPADVSRLAPGDVEPTLAHELAHLRRRDLWVAAAVTVLQVVYWFHPLVWIARWRLERLTEQCCDRTVLRALDHDTRGYRRALLRFAALRMAATADLTPGLGFVTPRNPLLIRLSLLESAARERLWRVRLATGVLALGMFACVLPMAPVAERSAAAVAEMIERPPGCLPLRYLVLQRLAEEDGYTDSTDPEPVENQP